MPTVFENYTACLELDDQRVELSLWDTSGEDYYFKIFKTVISSLFCQLPSPPSSLHGHVCVCVCEQHSFSAAFMGWFVKLVYPPTTQSARSRVTAVNEAPTAPARSHSLFNKQLLLLFTHTLLSARPVSMQLSSFSLVRNLFWMTGLTNKPAWIGPKSIMWNKEKIQHGIKILQ